MIFTKMTCPNPQCGMTLVVQVEMKGRKAKCEKCGYKFYIPDLSPREPGAVTMIARRFAGMAPPEESKPDLSAIPDVDPSEEPPPLPQR